ncbi:MAG: HAMP domain-containing histidine kinase [Bacteroidales bacterium]|nr:HAMP domain-containing histidine kinase [Bacteroidales bacterium]
MSTWIWLLILIAVGALSVLITALVVRRKDSDKVNYMMDALEDGEQNFRFRSNTALNRALNRFRSIIDKQSVQNESVSWSKLFRVMTHEIMNTITPIASLSDALSKDSNLDTQAGLETISASSKELIRFVESYRSFTRMAPPVRKTIAVDELINRVIQLHQGKTLEQDVSIDYEIRTADLLIYADEGQLMQVFNNLIKNAIQAEATKIRIVADLNAEDQTVISIINNGKPVPQQKREEIFVPFYTTKANGSGIGLSLSRQIMIHHNGMLNLVQSDNHSTVFALVFK